jgi:hypothetical protein
MVIFFFQKIEFLKSILNPRVCATMIEEGLVFAIKFNDFHEHHENPEGKICQRTTLLTARVCQWCLETDTFNAICTLQILPMGREWVGPYPICSVCFKKYATKYNPAPTPSVEK